MTLIPSRNISIDGTMFGALGGINGIEKEV